MALSAKGAKFGIRKLRGTNKKGKEYQAYIIRLGDYETPMLFPTKLESKYLDDFIGEEAHEDFKKGDPDHDKPLDDLDD